MKLSSLGRPAPVCVCPERDLQKGTAKSARARANDACSQFEPHFAVPRGAKHSNVRVLNGLS